MYTPEVGDPALEVPGQGNVTSLACDQLSFPSEQSPSRQATSRHLAGTPVRSAKVQRARSTGLSGSVGPRTAVLSGAQLPR